MTWDIDLSNNRGVIPFRGIKYSPKTKIFYKFANFRLYKRVAYHGKDGNGVWERSVYADYSGNSKRWTKATASQIREYRLDGQKANQNIKGFKQKYGIHKTMQG